MRRLTRDSSMTVAFVAAAFVLALLQRPGKASSDTKIDVHVDPGAFLGQVASLWTPSIDLGAVHSVQYSGYLWPMGPFFAALDGLGLPAWVTHRLWLGLILALSAWGLLRLLDVLIGRPRGIAHAVAAAFYVLNPYTVMFSARTSIILVGYAALPWMLLVVWHGVRTVRGWGGWRGWWWAAVFALVLTSLSGGINAAVVAWMLVGPLVLLVYEPAVGAVRWRDSLNFLLRMGALGLLASLWWIVPLLAGSRYGIDFLQFTEKPATIWAANSVPEALRLMAYWTSYTGYGFGEQNVPFFTDAGTLLFNPWVVGASLLLPALAIAGFVASRRYRYGPFLLGILLAGMAIEVAGFPRGTPSREVMDFLYREVVVLRFMRTTQKAAPLVALGVAGLLGLAARLAWLRLRTLAPGPGRRVALVGAPLALAAMIALAALPLVRGTAPEKQLTWDEIPRGWVQAGSDLDSDLPRNGRALVLPGQIFGYYDWGGTVDAILPRLTDRPVAVRYETPYSDARAHDLLFSVDRLVTQGRLVPGQLVPLLRLMGVGAVVAGSDDDLIRSGSADPVGAAAELARQGLDEPDRAYGPRRALPAPRGEPGPGAVLPRVRRYDLPVDRGLVHVLPTGPATIVDGGAEGIAALAAFGALPPRRPLFYAADRSEAELRRDAAAGADLVVTDSNRRRRFLPEYGRQNLGAPISETEPIDPNWATIDPFPDRGPDAQTVAALRGAAYVRAPNQAGLLEFPERSPFAAFDSDPGTAWVADRYLPPRERWIQVGFDAPRDVPWIELEPTRDPFGVETEVDVNGRRARLGPGTTRIPLGLEDVDALRVTITKVDQPPGELRGSGGFKEIRIPGVSLRQPLRTPIVVGRALAGRDLSRSSLTYLFERTTADEPFRRDRRIGSPQLELPVNRQDTERVLDRVTFSPARRSYDVDAWVHPAVDVEDPVLDRLLGVRTPAVLRSSDRFRNRAGNRAASAFDGRADTAWTAVWAPPSARPPWIEWTTRRPLEVSRLRIEPPAAPVRRPRVVRVSSPSGRSGRLPVRADGSVTLGRPITSRTFRVTVLEASFPPGTSPRARAVRAVGIGSLAVPGLGRAGLPANGPLRTACGDVAVRVAGSRVPLRVEGTRADLLAGGPLRARSCGGRATMGEGVQDVRGERGPWAVDLLRLRSPAPRGLPGPTGGGRVVDPGRLAESSLDDARVALDGPAWLVMGQSFSEGWHATCDGRDLGAPVAIDGYANGWRAPADCRRVSFDFAPQAAARAGYLVSAVVCALLLVFLLVARGRGGPSGARVGPPELALDDRPRPLPLARAAALALVATIPLAVLFAARSFVVILPVLALILWRGVGPQPLTAIAAGLLGAAVPLAYVISSPEDRGGYNFEYSLETIWAHWIGVAALVLLFVVAGLSWAATRRAAAAPVDPGPPDPAPAPGERELVTARAGTPPG